MSKAEQTIVMYECASCGHLTTDPEKDLRDMDKRGFVTCCLKRNMVRLVDPSAVVKIEESEVGRG